MGKIEKEVEKLRREIDSHVERGRRWARLASQRAALHDEVLQVESAVKQVGQRLKLPGAQWKPESVSAIASLRSAYLNGLLDL